MPNLGVIDIKHEHGDAAWHQAAQDIPTDDGAA
jgi:hypothetical protein